MGIGKSATTNTASTTSANPQAAAAYSSLLNQAQGVASTPYQAYTGELTAPVNSQQQQGIAGINASANQAQPSIQQALGIAGNAANPLTAAQIQQYQNPYTQDVVNATQNQFNENNQQQQEALTGNTIASGALGGNRAGIAANNLSTQQATAQNPVIAGLYANSYNSGLATANQQYQTNPLAAAGSIANFGVAGQTAAQSGAGAQLGAGTVEQQTQQAADTANQAAYAQQQAYPFQTAQWLAGIDTGVGSALGSSSTGTTTAPAPNQTAQYAGLGLAAASFLARGGRVGYAGGGPVQHMGVGGTPWSNAPTWVPTFSGTKGVAPHAGSAPSAQTPTAPTFDYGKIVSANNNSPGLLSNLTGGTAQQNAADDLQDDLADGSAYYGAPETAGGIYRSGGVVKGYADGGAPDDDVFGDDNRAIAYDLLRKREGIAAPDAIPGGEPAPSQGVAPAVWNPDQPYRMPDQAATDDWRAGHPIPALGTPPPPPSDDDTDLPPEITSGATRAPKGIAVPSDDGSEALGYAGRPNATPAPSAGVAAAPDDNGGGLGLLHLSRNARSGLLAAGLGMLASRSSNFGNALGEGGLHGLEAYGAGEERDRKAADEAAKLSKEAQYHADTLAQQNRTATETERNNRAKEANAADKAPAGYQKADDGTLAYIKGGPHDPEQISAETSARTKKGTELDDDTVDAIAQRVAQGDTRAVIGLGRNPAGIAQIQKRVAEIFKEQGLDHEAGAKAILGNIADQSGRMTAERTQAGIAAKLAVYGRNVDNAIGVATKASQEANRTQFTPVNAALNAFKAQTGDPKIVALGQSLNTLTNEYARAIGSGHGTVHDKEQAETQLNQARSHEQLVAIMNVMRQEIQMTKKSMPEAREEMRELYSRPSSERGAVAPTGAPAVAPAAGTVIPPAAERVVGQTYQTPKGPARWTAQGWVQ